MATFVGFLGGGISFAPVFNFDIYPGTIITVTLYPLVMGYAIIRFNLFNIRMVVAQIIALLIFIFTFAQLFRSASEAEYILNAGLLFAALLLGIYLVRSVKREVEQRERAENLAVELEKKNTQLSEFMSLATHEIRNPATFIRGAAVDLLEGDAGPLSREARSSVQRILIRANDIIHLGNQYLNKSKLELDKLAYEFVPTDLGQIARDLEREIAPAAEQKRITVRTDIPQGDHTIMADMGKIKEVLGNILDNAIKYTPEGGSVTVSVRGTSDAVTVAVTDTGVGIPREVMPHLFQKFSRADAQQKNLMGSGLGLWLGKIFVEAHHGRISVASKGKGKGSTFSVELPRQQPTNA